MQITTIGIDLAKNVFQVHGIDEHGLEFAVVHGAELCDSARCTFGFSSASGALRPPIDPAPFVSRPVTSGRDQTAHDACAWNSRCLPGYSTEQVTLELMGR